MRSAVESLSSDDDTVVWELQAERAREVEFLAGGGYEEIRSGHWDSERRFRLLARD